MTWDKVLAQEDIKNTLQRAIIDNRISHAYCLWGDVGVGKEAIALEFAKTVNCDSPIITHNSIEYCNVCNSCKLSNSMYHPNISLVFASPAAKSGSDNLELSNKQIDELSEQLKLKRDDYYHKMTITGGTQIRVDSIRNIRKSLSKSAAMQGRRVIIVCRADEMQKEAANAFLKTLEEPHDNVTIILTTAKKEFLLQTILSRCQVMHVPGISKEEIISYLIEKHDISDDTARLAASFSIGSLSRAVEFIFDEMQSLRTESVNLLRTAMTPRDYRIKLSKSIDELTRDKDKRKIEDLLNILIIWLRDIVAFRSTGNAVHLVNIDHIPIFEKFIQSFANADINEAIEIVENAYKRIRRNVPLNLLLLDMYINLRNTFYNR